MKFSARWAFLLSFAAILASCGKNTQFSSSGSIFIKNNESEQPAKPDEDGRDDDVVVKTKPLPDEPKSQDKLQPSLPIAILTGYPTGESSNDQIAIGVSGHNVVAYGYATVVGGAACSDSSAVLNHAVLPQQIQLDITRLPEGPIRVCVWGEDGQGAKQIVASEASWTKKYISCEAVPNGQIELRTVYQALSVPFGASCVSGTQSRTCVNGTWTGWAGSGFSATSCTTAAPVGCGPIPHAGTETRTVYESSSVPFNSTCTSGTQTRTCSNGVMSGWSGSSFSATSCVVNDNTRPNLSAISARTVAEGQTLSVSFSATDAESEIKNYQCVSNCALGFSISGNTLTWTPNFSQGQTNSHHIGVVACDMQNLCSDAKTLSVTVQNVNRAPTSNGSISTGYPHGYTGLMSTFNLINFMSDPDGDALTYTCVSGSCNSINLSNNSMYFPASVSPKAGLSAGTYTSTVRGCDPSGSCATLPVTVVVAAPSSSCPYSNMCIISNVNNDGVPYYVSSGSTVKLKNSDQGACVTYSCNCGTLSPSLPAGSFLTCQ